MITHKRQIWSENSCVLIANDLRQQAEKWEKRAAEIRNFRGNMRPIEDPAPAMKAAIRVLTAEQNGMDPIQECSRASRRFYIDRDTIWQLYRHKKAAYERERRAKRNRAIIKMSLKMGVREIARRVKLSPATVSAIIKKGPTPQR